MNSMERMRVMTALVSRDEHTLVFVAGLHRSGTTALARCLASHPDFSGMTSTGVPEDEGQHLQNVYPPAKSLGGPGRFALNPTAHLTEHSPLATDDSAARLWAAWAPHWQAERHFLVEKSPPNLLMTRFLTRLFPEAVHLIITRHPVVVTLSTAKWADDTELTVLFDNWFTAHDTFRKDLPDLPRVKVISYEALTRRPMATLTGLAEFLGLDVPPPHHIIEADRSSGYERSWASMERSSAPSVRANHAMLTERYSQRALTFGYRMDDLAFEGASCLE